MLVTRPLPSQTDKLLFQSLTSFLVLVLCNVHIRSHPLNDNQEQITLSKEGNSDFTLWMERTWRPLCCHGNVTVDMEFCDENNSPSQDSSHPDDLF